MWRNNVRAAFSGILEIGGGIRDEAAVKLYMDMGIDRIILGSRGFEKSRTH